MICQNSDELVSFMIGISIEMEKERIKKKRDRTCERAGKKGGE